MDKILREVLKKVTPSKKERASISAFSRKVIKQIKAEGFEATVQGSLAKDTGVSGTHDIDVFVFFEPSVSREKLEKASLKLGKKVIKSLGGKPEVAYAEHPYVRSSINGWGLDVVPCYKLESAGNLQSAVDRTPFHTEFIRKNLKEAQKKEVRLLKQFMKGVGVYSAKEKVRGFSGYLCELLILQYGTFKKLITDAQKWNFGKVMGLNNLRTDRTYKRRFVKVPMIFVDPVDENRNVAAALKQENFSLFVYACSEFLKKPSLKFFFPGKITPLPPEALKPEMAEHGRFVFIKFKAPKVIEDVLYSQIRRSLNSIQKKLKKEGYEVLGADFFCSKYCYFLFELKYVKLPQIKKVEGPPIDIEQKYQKVFTKKYKKEKPWVEGGRWYVEVPREYTDVVSLLVSLMKNPRKLGVSNHISEKLKENYELLQDTEVLKEYKGEFGEFLTNYLVKTQRWEW